jgi:predicted MFS family arabinose efflux permease
VFSPLLGGVAYEVFGMNAPLWFMVVLLLAMLAFALRSRRLRGPALLTPAPEQPPPH